MFDELSYLLSMLFTMALICYSLFAVYVMYLDPRASMNRAFAGMCIFMAIWSFTFGVAVSASTLESAIFWRRLAVFGYGGVYSVFLHMSLILSNKIKKIKRKWFWLLIYGPALVNVVLYALPIPRINYPYKLAWTSLGWMNVADFNNLDWFFYVYYIGFSLITLVNLLQWYRKCETRSEKRQSLIILTTSLIGVVFASFFDVFLVHVLRVKMPQIAPVILLIPLMAILYIIMVYGLMRPRNTDVGMVILRSAAKGLIYRYLSIGLFIGGILTFVFEYYIEHSGVRNSLIMTGVLFLYAISIHVVVRSSLFEEHKDSLVLLVVVLLMPFLQYTLGATTDKTLWVLPFLLLIVFILYNNSKMIVGIGLAALLSYGHYWIVTPLRAVVITEKDILIRVLLLCVGILFSIIINRFFLLRLKENAHQVRNQQLISEISALLVSAGSTNFDAKINKVLELVGKHYQVDRSYLFSFNEETSMMCYSHDWCVEGLQSEVGKWEDRPMAMFPWWLDQLRTHQVVNINSLELLPQAAQVEREEFSRQKIQSTLSVSISIDEKMVGYIGLDAVAKQKKWGESYMTNLRIIGNVLSDAFAKNQGDKAIHSMAYYDQLTGLPSRQLFADRIEQAIKTADRVEERILVAMLDLDGFKSINDTMGHDVGDELLVHVARRLEGAVRESDTVSRFGGDEFLLLCGGIKTKGDAEIVGAEIIQAFREKFIIGDEEFYVTASLGLAIYPEDGKSNEKLVKNADIAMYNAKCNGKNNYALCSNDLKALTLYNAQLSNALYHGIEAEEFYMCYQPQVALMTGDLIGVEALIRWHHKDLGLIEPTTFIKIAERNGYILDIGEWVLNKVLEQMAIWAQKGYDQFDVAVNIPFLQITNPNFIDKLKGLLKLHDVDPTRLEIEITESVAMSQKTYIGGKLNDLRDLGIKIAIDDFGTEYSSLGRLRDLTVDKIKIAKPFIDGISVNYKDEAIVRSIIALAKNLKVALIAEGVETDQQRAFLLKEEVDYVQGFLYYQPMSADQVETLLKAK